MYYLLSKKFLFFILLLPAVLAAGLFFILPLAGQVHDYVTLYRQAFVEPFPTILVDDGKIEFLDPVPVTITIGDAVQIICDSNPDTVNFSTSAQNSVLISEYYVLIKSPQKVEKINLSNLSVQDEPIKITSQDISSFIDNKSIILLRFVTIVLFILVYLLLLSLTLLGAGIGVMIDAFSQGKFSFLPLLNLSGLVISIFTIIAFSLYYWHIIEFKSFPLSIGIFFLTFAVIVYLFERSAIPLYLGKAEK